MQLANESEAPTAFHFWTAVSTLAGAIRRHVWIDEIRFQWTPNFYIVLVGPPGIATKSTTMRIGLSMLQQIPGATIGPNSLTWQALTDALSEAREHVTLPDGSFEGKTLPMSCLTCAVSELGTFLRPDDKELVNVLTDLWDGQVGVWTRRTRQSGENPIENPWINLIGCTTPSWIRDNVPDSMVGGGLVSRCVFVYGDRKEKLISYVSDVIDEDKYRKAEALLIEDLVTMSQLVGRFEISREAKNWGTQWYESLWKPGARPEHMASDRYSGYIARKQTHIHKLAMILSVARSNDLLIQREDLEIADRVVTGLETDMGHVFQSIGMSDTGKNIREIMVYLSVHKKLERKKLMGMALKIMSGRDFKDALEAAIQLGYVKMQHKDGIPVCEYMEGSGFEP